MRDTNAYDVNIKIALLRKQPAETTNWTEYCSHVFESTERYTTIYDGIVMQVPE